MSDQRDIVERLRGLVYQEKWLEEAADEIDRLRTIIKAQGDEIRITREQDEAKDAEIDSLNAKLESARKALEPFATLAGFVVPTHRDGRPVIFGLDNVMAQRLTIGHLRAAKAALTDEEGKSDA